MKRGIVILAVFLSITVLLSGCDGNDTASAGISYEPPFAPVEFTINTDGAISVRAVADIVTLIGTFSLSAGGAISLQPQDQTILVVIRHKQNGKIVDSAYQVKSNDDTLTVVVDGKTTIEVSNRKVFIDASQGSIRSIVLHDPNVDATATAEAVTAPSNTTVSSSGYPHLRTKYHVTVCNGKCSPEDIQFTGTFFLQAQDLQGNVTGTVALNVDAFGSSTYPCTGKVTRNNKLTLTCEDAGTTYQFSGDIYRDGHIEGTLVFTFIVTQNFWFTFSPS